MNPIGDQKAAIPATSGVSIGSPNYVVTIGLGTPKKVYTLVFDTGSDLTWTQCQPCKSCHPQKDPNYNPSQSSTYSNVSCTSPQCTQLVSATGIKPACAGSTCVYGTIYGDGSSSIGFLAKETLTLGTDVFPGFLFGCGLINQGLFGKTDGLLGLGRHPISTVSQTAQKYGKVFSYCLPTKSGSNGYLSFGRGYSKGAQFTPFSTSESNNYAYFVDVVGISVGDRLLPNIASAFQNTETIVDSGTVITRLPPAAYSALSSACKQQMTHYKTAPVFSILDTCYDFSGQTIISIPKISFFFKGNAKIDLGVIGILTGPSISQLCLAFAGSNLAIFGNIQQETQQVVYDVVGGTIGFGAGGCS